MYKNDKQSIIKAQSGDKEELEELIKNNNRFNMEYCKKISR